jgi:RNA 2',3'-cyclic 3'-phosphodiesterase
MALDATRSVIRGLEYNALDARLSRWICRNLESFVARLKPSARIHWSPPANLHVTTKFIGEWPESGFRSCKPPFPGCPSGRRSRSNGGQSRGSTRTPVRRASSGAASRRRGWRRWRPIPIRRPHRSGWPKKSAPYSPHLTLARIKERVDLRSLHQAIAAAPSLDFGRFTARSFFLYRSQLRPTGSVYTKLAEFPFSK